MPDTVIKTSELTKLYGTVVGVRDLELEVADANDRPVEFRQFARLDDRVRHHALLVDCSACQSISKGMLRRWGQRSPHMARSQTTGRSAWTWVETLHEPGRS